MNSRTPSRSATVFATLVVGLVLMSGVVTATPIRYTLTGTATGSLGGTPFSTRPFTVVLETDTINVSTWSGDGQSTYAFFGPGATDPASTATIQLQGLPLATFTTWVEIFLAQGYANTYGSPLLSFGRPNTNTSLPGWAGMFAGGLTGVNLASEFGTSLRVAPDFCSTSGPANLFTDRGTLLTQMCGSSLTSITAQYLMAPVPVPAGAWLLGGALGALGSVRRRSARA